MKKKIKLTKIQKNVIMLCYAGLRYSETLQRKTKKQAEEKFVQDIEKVINDEDL